MKLKEIIKYIENIYPKSLAEDWDKVGLTIGSNEQEINKILFTVDINTEVADYAINNNYDLIFSHHPLLLKGVNFLPNETDRGNIISKLIKNNCSLYSAHTNADIAKNGVSDCLAEILELENIEPIKKNIINPEIGFGRKGTFLEDMSVDSFKNFLLKRLPKSGNGIRITKTNKKVINRVGVCGGAGDFLLDSIAQEEIDAYITSDLRHHAVDEFKRKSDIILVDIGHWVSEFPWCDFLAKNLSENFNYEIIADVYKLPTDNWV